MSTKGEVRVSNKGGSNPGPGGSKPQAGAGKPQAGGGKPVAKVLVVEDDYMNMILVKEMLTLHGYEVLEATTGVEAVDMAASERPDVIIMDLNLPEMDGVTATRIIKEGLPEVPVVALTASAMKGDEEDVLAKGFDGYVPKPIELERLLAAVSRGLGPVPRSRSSSGPGPGSGTDDEGAAE